MWGTGTWIDFGIIKKHVLSIKMLCAYENGLTDCYAQLAQDKVVF